MSRRQFVLVCGAMLAVLVGLVLVLPFGEYVRNFMFYTVGAWIVFFFQLGLVFVAPAVAGYYFRFNLLQKLDNKFLPVQDLNNWGRFFLILVAGGIIGLLSTTIMYYSAMFEGTLFRGFVETLFDFHGRWETFPTGILLWGIFFSVFGSYIGRLWII